jgi:hypothetical protein
MQSGYCSQSCPQKMCTRVDKSALPGTLAHAAFFLRSTSIRFEINHLPSTPGSCKHCYPQKMCTSAQPGRYDAKNRGIAKKMYQINDLARYSSASAQCCPPNLCKISGRGQNASGKLLIFCPITLHCPPCLDFAQVQLILANQGLCHLAKSLRTFLSTEGVQNSLHVLFLACLVFMQREKLF